VVIRALTPDPVPFERVASGVDRATRLRRARLLAVLTGWAADVLAHVIGANSQQRATDPTVAFFVFEAWWVACITRAVCRDALETITSIRPDLSLWLLWTTRSAAASVLGTALATAHDRPKSTVLATAFAFGAILTIAAAVVIGDRLRLLPADFVLWTALVAVGYWRDSMSSDQDEAIRAACIAAHTIAAQFLTLAVDTTRRL
jgi:hypothetical protein